MCHLGPKEEIVEQISRLCTSFQNMQKRNCLVEELTYLFVETYAEICLKIVLTDKSQNKTYDWRNDGEI